MNRKVISVDHFFQSPYHLSFLPCARRRINSPRQPRCQAADSIPPLPSLEDGSRDILLKRLNIERARTDRTLVRSEEGPKCLAAPPTAYMAQTIFSLPVAVDN